jgi:ribose-phosphate pyrophosphokinase
MTRGVPGTHDVQMMLDRFKKSKIKNLVVTDTIDNSNKVKKARNIEILTISNLLAEAMKRISNSTSVSDLFK